MMIGSHYSINEIPKCESITHTIYSSNICISVEVYSFMSHYVSRVLSGLMWSNAKRQWLSKSWQSAIEFRTG